MYGCTAAWEDAAPPSRHLPCIDAHVIVTEVSLRCFRAAAAALAEPHLHALLQLALLPAAFAAPAASAVLGLDAAPAPVRAVLRALAASSFLEVYAQICCALCCVTNPESSLEAALFSCCLTVLHSCGRQRHETTQAMDGNGEMWRMHARMQEPPPSLQPSSTSNTARQGELARFSLRPGISTPAMPHTALIVHHPMPAGFLTALTPWGLHTAPLVGDKSAWHAG